MFPGRGTNAADTVSRYLGRLLCHSLINMFNAYHHLAFLHFRTSSLLDGQFAVASRKIVAVVAGREAGLTEAVYFSAEDQGSG